ncbi:MAG: glutamate--tRNA ligase [Rhodospirillaceae bacterium]|nr:glutamate--tRNA ligase [Rhodospirillaceae bacterium]MCY4065369.1 glutamate--tRNA ligase [Rhodospirillaceae bacterium]
MTVVTRFAPSPTGFLHIGGARTALFNRLYARRHGGKFLLRIEDTDRARSTVAAKQAILEGLQWLGLEWDGAPVYQSARAERHAAVARALLDTGGAYRCYCSPEELAAMREAARKRGSGRLYDGTWRDRDPAEAPEGVAPVVRLRAPLDGETVIDDAVQGRVAVRNDQLDDMVLLRADGTPTYMLSVVVDDHDMDITHVVRGDDHLTNAFRQALIYRAMGWDIPVFAHIPLIHGPDGAKLSKRHGALGVEAYRDMGFPPEAVCNYLARLGWSHGDDEIFSMARAADWFDLEDVGKSPARFDLAKLTSLSAHYIREMADARLAGLIEPPLAARLGAPLTALQRARLVAGLPGLKPRARTLVDLAEAALFYCRPRPLQPDAKAAKLLDGDGRERLALARAALAGIANWSAESAESAVRAAAEAAGEKLGALAQPLRAALTGSTASPGIFEVLDVLGKAESLGRIDDSLGRAAG